MFLLFAQTHNMQESGGGLAIHLEHVLTGIIIGIVLLVPFVIYYLRKYKKFNAAVAATGKKVIHTEMVKSDIILASIVDGVIVIDTKGAISVFNQGAANLTGWPSEEAVGIDYKLVIKLVDEKGNAYLDDQDPFAKVFHDKAVYRDNKASLVTRSNKQVPLNLSVSPLLDNQGQLSGVVGVFRDVSQERAEEQRRAEFISTASHEMRTPVAAIEGYLALALNDRVSKIDTNARQYLEKAHSSTQHLGKLFQDLLTSAKAEDGRLVSHPSVVEMGEFLESLTDGLRFSAQKKGLLIDFVIGSSSGDATKSGDKVVRPLYYAHVDPERMR
jgi:PAS domain S-box-containing protein